MDQGWERVHRDMRKSMDDCYDAIRQAERTMSSVQTEMVVDNGDHLVYRITAKPWGARWRLFRVFARVAIALLFKGQSKLKVTKTLVVKDAGHPEYGQSGRYRSDAPNFSAKPQSNPKP